MEDRLRAVCDLAVPEARELVGRHEYDGRVQDLSPAGVAGALSRLGRGAKLADPHDERHLSAVEDGLRVGYGELELHRRNPLPHLANLDLACYDREYAPVEERAAARRRHVAAWPDAVEAAITSLDLVSAPVAEALLDAVRGLTDGLPRDGDPAAAARRAHRRLVTHLERAAEDGDPDPALGGSGLARLMGVGEATTVDLADLAVRAEGERARLSGLLADACRRLDPARPPAALVPELLADHPAIEGVLVEARALTDEVLAFSRERGLAPYLDGECRVGPAPPSRRWAAAMMSWAAPEEPDAPSLFQVTPPEPDWPAQARADWLATFSRTTLPALTAHEVAPGHYAHGRALRRAATPVRRIAQSATFAEGWAHYVEEVMVEEGFRAGDPRFPIGVWLEALTRVTRLTCAIGVHTGAMTVREAAGRFMTEAFHGAQAARSEARRATFDPGYGRYTWAKLALLELRQRARARNGFTLARFHADLLALGSPPLGLTEAVLDGPRPSEAS